MGIVSRLRPSTERPALPDVDGPTDATAHPRRGRRRALAAAAVVTAGATATAVVLTGGGANAATGGWASMNFDLNNSRANTAESTISAANAGKLAPVWKAADLMGDTSTPAVVGGVVYTGAWDGTARAYDEHSGALKWKTQLTKGYPDDNHGQIDDSPAVADGKVFIGTGEGHIVALNAASGAVLWTYTPTTTSPHIWSSPTVIDGRVIVGVGSSEVADIKGSYTSRGQILSLDENTGTLQWQFYTTDANGTSGAGCSVWSTAAIDPALHLAYIGVGQNVTKPASQYEDSILAIDYTTGKLAWNHQYTSPDIYRILSTTTGHDFDIGASPNLFTVNGTPAVGVGDKGGHYVAFNRATGAILWQRQLAPGSHLGGDMSTAAVHDGTIYIAENDWTDATSLVVHTATLSALNATTGATLWTHKLPSPSFGDVTWANGVLYVPTTANGLFVLNAQNGSQLANLKPGGGSSLGGGVSVIDGMVFSGWGWWFLYPQLTGPHPGGLAAFAVPGTTHA